VTIHVAPLIITDRPLAGAALEGGTNRGRGAGADVVGLISKHARQRADLQRHLHRGIDRRVPRRALAKRDGGIEGRDSEAPSVAMNRSKGISHTLV